MSSVRSCGGKFGFYGAVLAVGRFAASSLDFLPSGSNRGLGLARLALRDDPPLALAFGFAGLFLELRLQFLDWIGVRCGDGSAVFFARFLRDFIVGFDCDDDLVFVSSHGTPQ